MKRPAVVLLACILVCGLISGCNLAGGGKLQTPYPVRVAGVTIEKVPEKVVCLSPSLAELTCELGYGSRLIGRTDDTTYPEQLAALPTVGKTGKIDFAAVIGLEPDTVVSHSSLSKKEITALEEAKVKVVVLPMAKSLGELRKLYQQLALLYAGELDAESVSNGYYQKLTDRLTEVKTLLSQTDFQKSFGYIIHPTNGLVATDDTLEGSLLSFVFGENAAATGTKYQVEATVLATKNPSVLLVAEPYGLPHLESNKNYQSLDAVKNKKVVTVNPNLLATQSLRMADEVKAVAKALYPELFAEEESSSADSSSTDAAQSSGA